MWKKNVNSKKLLIIIVVLKIIKKIKEIKYDKFISAEILPSPDFITSLKEFIQFMKKREE